MNFGDKCKLLDLLYLLKIDLKEQAESTNTDVDETLDEAIRTLINYLD